MTSRRAPHIVSATPALHTSRDRCAAALAKGANPVSPPRDAENATRDQAWSEIKYFNSLRKVGGDALVYQARE